MPSTNEPMRRTPKVEQICLRKDDSDGRKRVVVSYTLDDVAEALEAGYMFWQYPEDSWGWVNGPPSKLDRKWSLHHTLIEALTAMVEHHKKSKEDSDVR